MLHIFFNYTELHRLKEAVFVLHMVNVGLGERKNKQGGACSELLGLRPKLW